MNAVNDAPLANSQSVTTPQNVARFLTLTGSDADSDALSFTVVAGPANGILSGTAPSLTYTPNPGFYGSDSFSFRVNDASATSAVATVTITVQNPDPSYGASAGQPFTITAPAVSLAPSKGLTLPVTSSSVLTVSISNLQAASTVISLRCLTQ